MSDREVKTGHTAEEVADKIGYLAASSARDDFYEGWNAALDSVIIPEGRFELGDEVELDVSFAVGHGVWTRGRIQAVSMDARHYTYQPQFVRPLPKTVELTVNEKIREVATAMLNKIKPMTSDAMVHEIIDIHIEISQDLANGKTIDQLCAEHGVSTTKELS